MLYNNFEHTLHVFGFCVFVYGIGCSAKSQIIFLDKESETCQITMLGQIHSSHDRNRKFPKIVYSSMYCMFNNNFEDILQVTRFYYLSSIACSA